VTLLEMAAEYRENALLLRDRRNLLKEEWKRCTNPERRQRLERRVRDLSILYRESRETALMMERYYEGGEGHGRIPQTVPAAVVSGQRVFWGFGGMESGAQRGQQRAAGASASESAPGAGTGADTPAAVGYTSVL